jgi:hypoxanthine phosphoribosyltransferase
MASVYIKNTGAYRGAEEDTTARDLKAKLTHRHAASEAVMDVIQSAAPYTAQVDEVRSNVAGVGEHGTKPVVIASPALEPLAASLRKLIAADESNSVQGPTIHIDTFTSKDANIKFNWQKVIGRKVVLLFDTTEQNRFFEQLALLQALQGFPVPDGSDSEEKWKTYIGNGNYSWGRAARILVVMPWYRPCQMERTSRWQLQQDGATWRNDDPEGMWLDVPSALYYARLLCTPGPVPPLPGPHTSMDSMPLSPLWRPPVELLFVELHEEAPVMQSVGDLGATIRMERFVPYFLEKFRASGTYPGHSNMYIVFPDHGAHGRYAQAVKEKLSLGDDHILYIPKTRVGEKINQLNTTLYERANLAVGEQTSFLATDSFLIIDDFTNSGSTLFGATKLVHKLSGASESTPIVEQRVPHVSIFVSHIVAHYNPAKVAELQESLHALGPKCKLFCTNSIPQMTDLLHNDPQVEVYDLSEFIADMVK